MSNSGPISATTTTTGDDVLELRYVPLDTLRRWERNHKRHDLGALAVSIARHGFKDPPKFEPMLNGGEGGVAEGNGRSEILAVMRAQGGPRGEGWPKDRKAPRGVMATPEGWLVPVLFGVDATSQAAAEAYAVAHNNLTMAGGDFTDADMAGMWEPEGYAALLEDLARQGETPVTVDESALDALLTYLREGPEGAAGEGEEGGEGEGEGSDGSLLARVEVVVDDPRTAVERGQVWTLGPHTLLCADVFADWPVWAPHLRDGCLFVPYAGPFVTVSKKAEQQPLVIVQPDTYIAGHIVDRWIDIHGENDVKCS